MIQSSPEAKDFSLDEHLDYQYDFPSGYQTFLYWMFLRHPKKALDYLIPFLNKALKRNQHVLQALGKEVEKISFRI